MEELSEGCLDALHVAAMGRLGEIDANPKDTSLPFREILGEEGYEPFLEIDPDGMSDEKLFV